MAGSTTKKVLVRRFDREPLAGYIHPQAWLRPNGVELLTPDGSFAVVSYNEVKAVHFVRDFDALEQPAESRVFNTRPKIDGLWVRMRFRDEEIMDGVMSNNLLLVEPYGFTVTPPEPFSNNQKVFVPRAALAEIQVLGVVGSPLTRARPKAKAVPMEQGKLFE
ncbi:MAG: hypothetical protein ACE15B_17360 [Bryobacteraceae bacterium]